MGELFDDEMSRAVLVILEDMAFEKLEQLQQRTNHEPEQFLECLNCLGHMTEAELNDLVDEVLYKYPCFPALLKRLVLVFAKVTRLTESQVSAGPTRSDRRNVHVPACGVFVSNFFKALVKGSLVRDRMVRGPLDEHQKRSAVSDAVRVCLVRMKVVYETPHDPANPAIPAIPANPAIPAIPAIPDIPAIPANRAHRAHRANRANRANRGLGARQAIARAKYFLGRSKDAARPFAGGLPDISHNDSVSCAGAVPYEQRQRAAATAPGDLTVEALRKHDAQHP